MNDSVRVVLKDLPSTVRAFVCLGSDFNPIIVINSHLSFEQQREAYLHELIHIRSGQLDDDNYEEYSQ